MHARRLAKPASVCARRSANICRLQVWTLARAFIGSRKHSRDKLDDLAPQGVELAVEPNFDDLPAQGVELAAQPLYIPLALFTATVEIAHAPPSYPTSFKNCSNSPRKFSGGPLVPSLIIGVTV
jgi:hypothetical protein